MQQWERLDKLTSEGMRHAEKSGPKFTDTFDWLPQLIQAVNAVRYWNQLLKRSKGQKVVNSTIEKARNDAGLPLFS
jgi:hypothetical protein